MTSQKDQTQALIDEIDGSLQKVISRLPWAASGQITQQRHLLQRIRSYLVMQQRSLVRQQRPSDPSEVTAKQVMQSVVQDMNDLRSSLLKPLQSEVATLTQQRGALIREIRQLEAHRQSYLLEQTPTIVPAQNTEQLQKAHEQTDQVLTTLDTTLRVVFESLQQDIQAYQDSLSQGLDKLHGLGQQGEVMFTTLVNRLAEQLGREASTYLHSQTSPDLPEAKIDPQRSLPRNSTESAKISLPYPGTEMSTGRSEGIVPQPPEAPSNPPDPSETISTLTELLEQLSPEASPPPHVISVMPPAIDPTSGMRPSDIRTLAEATYTPDENLLPPPIAESADLPLKLDSTTLNQLSQDLSNLDRVEDVSASVEPPAPRAAKHNSIFNLEGMDDLFVEDPPR